MAAGALRVVVIDADFLKLGGKVLALCDLHDRVVFAVAHVIEFHAVLLEGFELIADIGGSAHAEHAYVAENFGVGVGSGNSVAATHGEAGNSAAVLIRDRAVIPVDVRYDVFDQAFGKSTAEHAATTGPGRSRRVRRAAPGARGLRQEPRRGRP